VCDEAEFERAGHLSYFPLVGGDAAARETWRPAAGVLHGAFGEKWREKGDFAFHRIDTESLEVADRRISSSSRKIMTSSLGRLFDAVAFLLGICDANRYEAEAAMALEAKASIVSSAEPLSYEIVAGEDGKGPMLIDWRPMVRDIIDGLGSKRPINDLARAFHETVATMLVDSANRTADKTGINRVALSGGCFANRILLERIYELLTASGREVFVHDEMPPGDGCIALGQAVIASERSMRGCM
jgi:hydrogenase maturation protein HypF